MKRDMRKRVRQFKPGEDVPLSHPHRRRYYSRWKTELDRLRPNIPPGEWHNEPDSLTFKTESGLTGHLCRTVFTWSLCGYVGIGPDHPLYGVHLQETHEALSWLWEKRKREEREHLQEGMPLLLGILTGDDKPRLDYVLKVHGGISYSSSIDPAGYRGRTGLWWLGFDCGHCDDRSPAMERFGDGVTSLLDWQVYRNVDYVKENIEKLASQLKQLSIVFGGTVFGETWTSKYLGSQKRLPPSEAARLE